MVLYTIISGKILLFSNHYSAVKEQPADIHADDYADLYADLRTHLRPCFLSPIHGEMSRVHPRDREVKTLINFGRKKTHKLSTCYVHPQDMPGSLVISSDF